MGLAELRGGADHAPRTAEPRAHGNPTVGEGFGRDRKLHGAGASAGRGAFGRVEGQKRRKEEGGRKSERCLDRLFDRRRDSSDFFAEINIVTAEKKTV